MRQTVPGTFEGDGTCLTGVESRGADRRSPASNRGRCRPDGSACPARRQQFSNPAISQLLSALPSSIVRLGQEEVPAGVERVHLELVVARRYPSSGLMKTSKSLSLKMTESCLVSVPVTFGSYELGGNVEVLVVPQHLLPACESGAWVSLAPSMSTKSEVHQALSARLDRRACRRCGSGLVCGGSRRTSGLSACPGRRRREPSRSQGEAFGAVGTSILFRGKDMLCNGSSAYAIQKRNPNGGC